MDKNCFLKGVITGRALKNRNTAAYTEGSNVVSSPVSARNYDKSSFLSGLSVGMGLKGCADRGKVLSGDYSGTPPELGYAWCLGKAVPVYTRRGLVDNPQYARFYISELPSFSALDYPYITISFGVRLLRFTENDFLSIMERGTFITKTGFPFMSMLHRVDEPGSTPYGYNWIRADDDRAYAICNYFDDTRAPKDAKFFDFYLSRNYYRGNLIDASIRYNGPENTWAVCTIPNGAPINCDRNGTWLSIDNISDYLVLTPII